MVEVRASPQAASGSTAVADSVMLCRRAGNAGGEERLCLVAREPGEPGPVAACQPIAARRAPHGLDGHACRHERLDVAMHRADGYLERPRDLGGGQLPTRLEQ